MPLVIGIENQDGRNLTHLTMNFHRYRLPDGTEMSIHEAPAWCHNCSEFVLVETLPAPDELEAQARNWYQENVNSSRRIFDEATAVNIAYQMRAKSLHQAAQWRIALSSRKSPPRCLECGGTSFVMVPRDSWMDHPKEAATRVRLEGGSFVELAGYGNLYDTEGLRIAGESARS